jgi:hypothetical protein
MSETFDPLEAELSALRPREVSPGLRRRIAERLADPPRAGRRTRRIALVAGLAAACLAVVLFRRGGGPGQGSGPRPDPGPVVVQPRPVPPVEVDADDSEPTLLAYDLALARSPEDLIALLNRRAAVDRESRPELARIGAFTRPDASLRTLLGED